MRDLIGNILVLLCSVALLASAGVKLAGAKRVVRQLETYDFVGRVALIGVGEAVSTVLFLIPPTRPIGLLLVSGLLGGAIATHWQHRESIVGPSVFLGVVWLAVWLRHAELITHLAGI